MLRRDDGEGIRLVLAIWHSGVRMKRDGRSSSSPTDREPILISLQLLCYIRRMVLGEYKAQLGLGDELWWWTVHHVAILSEVRRSTVARA